jgi:flavorubredoxin
MTVYFAGLIVDLTGCPTIYTASFCGGGSIPWGANDIMSSGVRVDEISQGVYRISVHVPEIGPGGFTFNHFVVQADEPLLFHCGSRRMFPAIAEAARKVIDIGSLRWISFGHVEGDECGSLNQWLAAAPHAVVTQGSLACELGLDELADRPPLPLSDEQAIDLGGKRVRFLATPHVPHSWDAGVMFEETTGTLLCGDLFAHFGSDVLRHDDIVSPAADAQREFMGTAVTTLTGPTLRRLATLKPRTLALMHGASFQGDCEGQLLRLAQDYDDALRRGAAA